MTIFIIAGAALVLVLGFGGAVVWRLTRQRAIRRALVALVGRREQLLASVKAFEKVVARLSEADDERLMRYAMDPADEDRNVLKDLGSRLRLFAEDLWHVAFPDQVMDVVRMMGEAAVIVSDQAMRAVLDTTDHDALDGLASVDLERVREGLRRMDAALDPLLVRYRIEDQAVYGGGLYI